MAGIKDKHRFIFIKYVPPTAKAAQESPELGCLGDSPMKMDNMPDSYADLAAENPMVYVSKPEGAADLVNAGELTGVNGPGMPEYPEQSDYPALPECSEEPEELECPEEPEEPEGPCPENAIVHVIQEGDTFWKLAKKYDTTVEAISDANPDVDPLNLQVGETLCIPVELPGAKG